MRYYFFRNEELRHLRAAQFFNYYTQHETVGDRQPAALRTDENTIGKDEEGPIPDDPAHRNFNATSNLFMEPGTLLPCARDLRVHVASARRRRNQDFCVARTAFLELSGSAGREAFYEQKLLQGLPWHCCKKPGTVRVGAHKTTQWFFETGAPFTPEPPQRFSMTERCLDTSTTFEEMSRVRARLRS